MRALLRVGLRFFLRDPWQLALAVLGVAIGVAVVVGVDLASASASRAFDRTIDAVGGLATHRIVGGPEGVPEDFYVRLRTVNGIRTCAPVIAATARVIVGDERRTTLQLLGVDPFAEAPLRPWLSFAAGEHRFDLGGYLDDRGVAMLRKTADELGVERGGRIELEVDGRRIDARVVGELEPTEPTARRGLARVAIADVSTVQELTGRIGWLDRIDLVLDDPGAVAEVVQCLPEGLVLESDPRRSGVLTDLTRAFRLNLQALGLLALLVGAFLIYNTMQFAVVRRRAWIGVMRAIGTTRRQVFASVILEAAAIGATGTFIGLVLGIVLAHGLVELVTATVRDFYFAAAVSSVELTAWPFITAIMLGIVTSVTAALGPAVEATSVEPRAALMRTELEAHVSRGVRLAVPVGILSAVLGLALLAFGDRDIVTAYAAIFAVLVGAACLVPEATVLLLRLMRAPLGRIAGTVGRWAARGGEVALSRTAVATAALTLAIATTVGLGVMIASFRNTVSSWLTTTLAADVYVSVPGPMSSRTELRMTPGAVERLRALPEVGEVSTYRRVDVDTRQGPIELATVEPAPSTVETLVPVQGSRAAIAEALRTGRSLLLSEPLAFRLGLGAGDELALRSDRGWRVLEIGAVFRDYGSERGYALIARRGYDAMFDDRAVASMALWAAEGVSTERLLEAADVAVAGLNQLLSVRSNRALREGSLEVFDRTFAITDVLRTLCIVVAFLGVWSALTAMQLERGREMGVLRAIGATPLQIASLLTLQNALLGLCAGLLALPMGTILAWLLVDVVNRRSFGWTLLSIDLSPLVLVEAVVVAVLAAVLAGALPSWRLARTVPAEVLRSE